MSTDKQAQEAAEDAVKAAATLVFRAAADLIYSDNHDWSTRPCRTCRAITEMTGVRFGCDRYRHERQTREDSDG